VKELAKSLEQPPHGWTAEALWRAYAQVERDRVRGAGAKRVFADFFRFRFPRPLRCLPEYH
jgi:type I restriction enzyme, R subunit